MLTMQHSRKCHPVSGNNKVYKMQNDPNTLTRRTVHIMTVTHVVRSIFKWSVKQNCGLGCV